MTIPPPPSEDRPKNASRFWSKLRALVSPTTASLRENIEQVLASHEEDIRPEARSMLLNLLEFADLRIDDFMVPKADITAISQSQTAQELLNLFTDINHSRLPVYRETLDDPLGMIHIKDFMRWLIETRHENLSTPLCDLTIVRPLLFVPSSMRAADLLVKMQATHIHMAIVVDEYGGTDGLVSIEDLVEQIVGDIADEHDQEEEPQIIPEEPGSYIADGRTPIEELEDRLGKQLTLEGEEADTLGGLILWQLDRVPIVGERIVHGSGFVFEVLDADLYRVKRVRISPSPEEGSEDP